MSKGADDWVRLGPVWRILVAFFPLRRSNVIGTVSLVYAEEVQELMWTVSPCLLESPGHRHDREKQLIRHHHDRQDSKLLVHRLAEVVFALCNPFIGCYD